MTVFETGASMIKLLKTGNIICRKSCFHTGTLPKKQIFLKSQLTDHVITQIVIFKSDLDI